MIPQELIDIIIAELREDNITLRQCSLVSRSFLTPCRKQLFAVIVLDQSSQIQRLSEALSLSSENVVSYIRELHVNIIAIGNDAEHLCCLLQMLARGGFLELFSYDPDSENFMPVPNSLKDSICEILKSPSIHTVRIMGMCHCQFPIEAFAFATHLKRLGYGTNVWHAECGQEYCDRPFLPVAFQQEIYLESLEMRSIPSISLAKYLLHPDCPIKISRLRKISIIAYGGSKCQHARNFLQVTSSTIESFVWWGPCVSSYGLDSAIFALNHLRSLTFYVCSGVSHLSTVTDILSFSMVPPNLEQLVIVIKHSGYRLNPSIIDYIEQDVDLDGVVSKFVGRSTQRRVPHVYLWLLDDAFRDVSESDRVSIESPKRFPLLRSTGFSFGLGTFRDTPRILDIFGKNNE